MNMSQMDFFDKDMMASVLLDVSNTDLPMDYTRFEVTETAYSIVASNNRNVLLDMKRIGVKFYLDDFGSGYSSFSTIRDYDFDVVKLDMGFVQKIGTTTKANAVIQAIIDMAHAIGFQSRSRRGRDQGTGGCFAGDGMRLYSGLLFLQAFAAGGV